MLETVWSVTGFPVAVVVIKRNTRRTLASILRFFGQVRRNLASPAASMLICFKMPTQSMLQCMWNEKLITMNFVDVFLENRHRWVRTVCLLYKCIVSQYNIQLQHIAILHREFSRECCMFPSYFAHLIKWMRLDTATFCGRKNLNDCGAVDASFNLEQHKCNC